MNACVQQAKKNPSLNGWQAGRVGNNLEQSVMEWKDQYKHPMWQKKRLEALEASEYTCQCCFDSESQLHVHHRQYFKGRRIWEYDNSELEVLCDCCHERAHDDMSILKSILARLPVDCVCEITALIKGYASIACGPISSAGILDEIDHMAPACYIAGQIAAAANNSCSINEMNSLRDQLNISQFSASVVSIDINERKRGFDKFTNGESMRDI